MTPKNTICLWYEKDAEAAATFYAATFPDSKVMGVFHAPSDFPDGKKGDATGTRSSGMAARRVRAGGARTAGEYPGRSRRVR